MNRKDNWEDRIKDVLTLECDGLTASQDLKDRIDEKILTSQEAGNMKHLSAKKWIVGVVVGCLLISGGVFAAGRVVSVSSHSDWRDGCRSYSEMGQQEKKLGYAVDSVEQFANGYQFNKAVVGEQEGKDQDKNQVYSAKFMSIEYARDAEPTVSLYIEKPSVTLARLKPAEATRVCGDITLYYDSATYKFVPPDYELTAEDKANQEKDNYCISYGSDEVEVQKSSVVEWKKDGIQYQLIGFDLNLTADEMFDMAEEVMGTK